MEPLVQVLEGALRQQLEAIGGGVVRTSDTSNEEQAAWGIPTEAHCVGDEPVSVDTLTTSLKPADVQRMMLLVQTISPTELATVVSATIAPSGSMHTLRTALQNRLNRYLVEPPPGEGTMLVRLPLPCANVFDPLHPLDALTHALALDLARAVLPPLDTKTPTGTAGARTPPTRKCHSHVWWAVIALVGLVLLLFLFAGLSRSRQTTEQTIQRQ